MSSSDNSENRKPESSDESRRNLLKLGLGLGVIFAVGGVGAVAKSLISPGAEPSGTPTTTQTTASSSSASQTVSLPPPATPGFPVILVANSKDLQANSVVNFNYPLQETPNILVKLGDQAEGGVGPDSDIVAFSQVCQHLGCIYAFIDSGLFPELRQFLPGSWAGRILLLSRKRLRSSQRRQGGWWTGTRPVPMVILSYDSATGNIYATGMTPPTIFGYDTGSNDVSDDLQGGTLVS